MTLTPGIGRAKRTRLLFYKDTIICNPLAIALNLGHRFNDEKPGGGCTCLENPAYADSDT